MMRPESSIPTATMILHCSPITSISYLRKPISGSEKQRDLDNENKLVGSMRNGKQLAT